MLKDAQGLAVTTDSPEVIAAIDRFTDQALCYGSQAESTILTVVDTDPTCAIANAYAAAYYLSQENAADWQRAIPFLQMAEQHQFQATKREQLWVRAIGAWARREIDEAVACHEAITQEFPRDLLSVQQGQYHYFYRGEKKQLLQIAEAVLPANPENHYLYGMVAFGLEQCHRLSEAEAVARQAVELNCHDPWAHHAIAHVMETQERVEEGIAWMEQFAHTWEACNSMLYTHNWWHIALYYLKQQDPKTVLALYDAKVWGRARKHSPKDQVGAIALLLRLELQGLQIDRARWQELGNYLFPRVHEHALPFQDLHYIYALERAEYSDQVQEMLLSMEIHAEKIQPQHQPAWKTVAIPAARGIVAHAQQNWQLAIEILKPILPKLWAIGGSHAQRDLFEQIYLNALLNGGQSQEARSLLEKRNRARQKGNSQKVSSIYSAHNTRIWAS